MNCFVDAKPGDFIQLDFFDDLHVPPGSNALEMVWVVDINTERILRASRLSMLPGGLTKVSLLTFERSGLYRRIILTIL